MVKGHAGADQASIADPRASIDLVDLAYGMCRKKPLKLILTSATLDAEKFSAYFFGCPVLHIPGRQYEVQVVFSEENHERNYAAAAVDATLDMHLHQPPGDILVFLTGQAEIDRVRDPTHIPMTKSSQPLAMYS